MRNTVWSILAVLSGLAAGCNNEPAMVIPPPLVGARGVQVTRVAIYQGIERNLVDQGAAVSSTVPLVAEREALVRVFYETDVGYDGAEIVGQLGVDGGDAIEVRQVVSGASTQEVLDSTFNFRVPGARIGAELKFSIALLQPLKEGGAANPGARFPAEGTHTFGVLGKPNTLRVIIAPFAYHADGSGRLPDTSAAQVEKIRNRFLQLYPVSDVNVTVRAPYDWNDPINPDGSGWQQVGFTLYGFRSTDGAPEDVYYYGMFNPGATLPAYCGFQCLLGVTLLNDNPMDVGNPMLRLALGVGFSEVAGDTAAHELGHAHGRQHAPCGPGLDPNSIDPSYPYKMGAINVWGWDLVGGALVPPTGMSDIMGYCKKQWISDYNYTALSARGQHVNAASWLVPESGKPVLHEVIAVDGKGAVDWRPGVEMAPPVGGEVVRVTVSDEEGSRSANGHFYRYDHLPGGWLFVPSVAAAGMRRAEFTVDGISVSARR